jgi:hypothetical protein
MAGDVTEHPKYCKFFGRRLARRIEPTSGPGAELVTLEDAARFMGHMRPWRQARPTWDYAAELILRAATSGKAGRHRGRYSANGKGAAHR